MEWLCKFAGLSRNGYYKWSKRKDTESPKQQDDEFIKGWILECYNEVNGIYGYYRVKTWLFRPYGLKVNHKRVIG
ncbi:MAG: transposase [Bacillales bacterium]|nr:transposase [Bacillales bacterium]